MVKDWQNLDNDFGSRPNPYIWNKSVELVRMVIDK